MATCKCGNKIGSPLVSPKSSYSALGWFLVTLGISHAPVKVTFTCDNCGEALKVVTDKKHLREHTYR
ncbi:hypothetical protein [Candidatus Mycalebacterium sp.]